MPSGIDICVGTRLMLLENKRISRDQSFLLAVIFTFSETKNMCVVVLGLRSLTLFKSTTNYIM